MFAHLSNFKIYHPDPGVSTGPKAHDKAAGSRPSCDGGHLETP
jgi:hypothetical protein